MLCHCVTHIQPLATSSNTSTQPPQPSTAMPTSTSLPIINFHRSAIPIILLSWCMETSSILQQARLLGGCEDGHHIPRHNSFHCLPPHATLQVVSGHCEHLLKPDDRRDSQVQEISKFLFSRIHTSYYTNGWKLTFHDREMKYSISTTHQPPSLIDNRRLLIISVCTYLFPTALLLINIIPCLITCTIIQIPFRAISTFVSNSRLTLVPGCSASASQG